LWWICQVEFLFTVGLGISILGGIFNVGLAWSRIYI
jgi:hypothetical protein